MKFDAVVFGVTDAGDDDKLCLALAGMKSLRIKYLDGLVLFSYTKHYTTFYLYVPWHQAIKFDNPAM